MKRNREGFTLVEIMIVVAIIAILAALAVPNFLRARKRAQITTFLETLRCIDAAKDQYCIEYNKSSIQPTVQDLIPYAKPGSPLVSALALAITEGGASTNSFWDPKFYHVIDYQIEDSNTEPQITGVSSYSDVCNSSFWSPYTADVPP